MKSNREMYVEIRNGIHNSFFVDYYYSRCNDKCIKKEEFHSFFPAYMSKYGQQVVEKLDKEFNIVKIFNKHGELIKYI